MSFSIQKKIPVDQLSETQPVFTTLFSESGVIIGCTWSGVYRQLFMGVGSAGTAHYHFSGYYFGVNNYQARLKVPMVGNPSLPLSSTGYFTPNGLPDDRYEIKEPGASLRLDDCTLIDETGEIIKFDLHADYNSNGNASQDSVVILVSGLDVDKMIKREV